MLPSVLQSAVDRSRSLSPHENATRRVKTLEHWISRARDLQADEDALHTSLPESLACILKPKRLLLWKEMMVYYEYPDPAVFEEVL